MFKMFKVVLFMLIVIAADKLCNGEVHEDFLHIYHRLKKTNCIDDTGVTKDLIERANKGDFEKERTLKCYMECHMEELDIITDDGNIDYDRIMVLVPDNHKQSMGPILKECCGIANKEADQCDRAFLMNTCYHERDPQMFFLA